MQAPVTQVALIERLQGQINGPAFNQRDCAIFDATYRPFLMAVTAWAGRSRGLRPADDEDVVQEVLFDLYAGDGLLKYQRIDPDTGRERRLSTWLRMKIETRVHTRVRSKARRAKWEAEGDAPLSDEPDAATPISLALSPERDAAEQLADEEQKAEDLFIFHTCRERVLGRRNAASRKKVELYEQGLQGKEIAERCECSVNSVEVLIHDIKNAIAREMEDMRYGRDLNDWTTSSKSSDRG